jgi:tyrosine-protein phosphatase SIW14
MTLLLWLVAACQAVPEAEHTAGVATTTRLADGGGLQHVAMLCPEVYRGAQPTREGYRRLRAMGVKTVINLRRFTDSRDEVEAAGLNYVSIPIYASIGSSPPTDEQLQRFFDTVLDPSKQPVFLHCKHGKDRTGMMAALYRIERQGWSNLEAIAEMQQFGYHDVFVDLIGFVRSYQRRGYRAP